MTTITTVHTDPGTTTVTPSRTVLVLGWVVVVLAAIAAAVGLSGRTEGNGTKGPM
jgi:hypothetical protein